MKTNTLYLALVLIFLLILNSCQSIGKCEEIQKGDTTILIDISDNELFQEIRSDIKTNFPEFMRMNSFEEIFIKSEECKQLKLSIGALSAKDELSIAHTSVGTNKRGLSRKERRKQNSSEPIIQLVKETLDNYSEMSEDDNYNSSTNILNTILKAIVSMDVEAQNTLFVFSDMIINNKKEGVNFYKSIANNVKPTLQKLIDPNLLQGYKNQMEEGLELKIVVVLKEEQRGKIKTKDVKAFWIAAFNTIGLNDVQFIDNLSNRVILWE